MKNLKLGGLVVIALAMAMICASTSLATYATSPAGTIYTGTLSGKSEGNVIFHGIVDISCEGAVEGEISSHGPAVTGQGKATKWLYTKCGGTTIESLATGTIEIHNAGKGVGTITSNGTTALAKISSLGISCEYTTINTDLGVVTDSSITKGAATIDLEATIPRTGGSIFCGSSAELTGYAVVETPKELFID